MEINKAKIEEYFENKSTEFKQKIRDEAVKRAKQTLRRTGRRIDEITLSTYEEMIAAEEEEIKKQAMKWGFASVILEGSCHGGKCLAGSQKLALARYNC